MEFCSEYPGPSRADYANVLALNTAFLEASSDLKGPQRARLAAAPFLLFSLREIDLDWWASALADDRQGDLIAVPKHATEALCGLQSASISFLWQLADRNPYAARIISGATIAWCEMLTGPPLVTVLKRVGMRSDLIISRPGVIDLAHSQLLGLGVSSRRDIRRSSHFTALQSLLTRSRVDQSQRLSAAACSMPAPGLKAVIKTDNRVCEKKV